MEILERERALVDLLVKHAEAGVRRNAAGTYCRFEFERHISAVLRLLARLRKELSAEHPGLCSELRKIQSHLFALEDAERHAVAHLLEGIET